MAYNWFTMPCGCSIEIDLYVTNGCCCGECYSYDSTEIESVKFESMCEQHTNADPA